MFSAASVPEFVLCTALAGQRIVTMEALPENAIGKVDRKRLRTLIVRD